MANSLRASKIGFPCDRHLWYSVNGFEGNTQTKSKRIFDVGTCLEPLIVQWLIDDGWDVKYNPGSQSAEIELFYPLKNGSLAGHPDCFISKGEIQNALVDIKTMNDRAFTSWKKDGSLKSKPQYVDQLHVYAGAAMAAGYTIEHLGIVGMNKNNSEIYIDFFDFDNFRFQEICNRADFIFSADNPPAQGERMQKWGCNYCEFNYLCELFQNNKKDTHVENGIANTNDEIILNAMQSLKDARELSKTAKELEDQAKSVLDEKVRQQGLNSVQGGGLIFNISERESSRFDTTAFKKSHPELVSQFTKKTTSLIFDIKEME